ncbi:hypothetical protein QR680_011007 [Steinernema hermaphroditum]|uniref:Uncharacterized protein n=1 Tax=Steinernema hermaphroditum TaxID=289476 RepID=A0AA39MCH5_9BILA|nr:hypothetical protein QR680_011007 [Steinernema hermaphroditum]
MFVLQLIHVFAATVQLTTGLLSTLLIIFRTPPVMRGYSIFLLNINFWFHNITFFCSTIVKATFAIIDSSFCFFYVAYIPFLKFNPNAIFFAYTVTSSMFNCYAALFLAFGYIYYRTSTLIAVSEAPGFASWQIWAGSVALHVVLTLGNVKFLSNIHIPSPPIYNGTYELFCIASTENHIGLIVWSGYYLVVCVGLTTPIIAFIVGIRKKILHFSTMVNQDTIKMQKSVLKAVLLMAASPLLFYVIPMTVVAILFAVDMSFMDVLVEIIIICFPVQASFNSLIVIFTIRPYREALRFRVTKYQARVTNSKFELSSVSRTRTCSTVQPSS